MELSGNSLAQRMVRRAIAHSGHRDGTVTPDSAPPAFEQAIDHFAHGRWSEAFETLVALADTGHCEAARIALLMATRGPRLFGRTFSATPLQRGRWHVAASRLAPAQAPGAATAN